MELKDILTWSGTGLLLILSFIKIPKIELDLWLLSDYVIQHIQRT